MFLLSFEERGVHSGQKSSLNRLKLRLILRLSQSKYNTSCFKRVFVLLFLTKHISISGENSSRILYHRRVLHKLLKFNLPPSPFRFIYVYYSYSSITQESYPIIPLLGNISQRIYQSRKLSNF